MITTKILKQLDLIGKVRSNIEYIDYSEQEKELFCKKCIEKKVTLLINKKTREAELVNDDDLGYPTAESMLKQGLISGIKAKNFSDLTEDEQRLFTEFKENWWKDDTEREE